MAAKVIPLSTFGAEIRGVAIGQPISDEDFGVVRQAFADHGLIVFRDQSFDEDAHIAFAERWAPVNINRFFEAHPAYPKIALVVKEPDQKRNIGGRWHTDHSYDLAPALGSILVARELPPAGGATRFASMYRAYDSLSAGMKSRIAGLAAVHSSKPVFGSQALGEALKHLPADHPAHHIASTSDAMSDVVHPVALTHPISGKIALYVNPEFTLRIHDMDAAESSDLLAELYAHGSRAEHVEEFHWTPGSVAFWDNRATWHLADNDYHGFRREMHRVTIEGEPLSGSRYLEQA